MSVTVKGALERTGLCSDRRPLVCGRAFGIELNISRQLSLDGLGTAVYRIGKPDKLVRRADLIYSSFKRGYRSCGESRQTGENTRCRHHQSDRNGNNPAFHNTTLLIF